MQDRLGGLNPAAPQIIAENGVVDPASLFDAGLYDPKTKSLDVQNWLKAEAHAESHDHEHGTAGHGHTHQHNDVNRHDAHIKALCLTIDEEHIPAHVHGLVVPFSEILGDVAGRGCRSRG